MNFDKKNHGENSEREYLKGSHRGREKKGSGTENYLFLLFLTWKGIEKLEGG